MGETPSFDELVAWSLDAEPALLPYLPRLFEDLEELGAYTDEVLQILGNAQLPSRARVLDLGCGKGAVAVALAQEIGCTVHGVDGLAAFVAHAEARADEFGVGEQCVFAEADVRDAVLYSRGYDLVCLLALGDVLGSAAETVATLRECVKPQGYILIDDAYLREGVPAPEDLIQCHGHAQTVAMLSSSGDELVAELVIDGPDSREKYEAMTDAIARRAEELVAENPADAELLRSYVERQKEEVEILSGPVVGALWLLRRSDHSV